MPDHYCNCEDWPCCGHGSGAAGGGLDPEDAGEWLDGLDDEERHFAKLEMVPCVECGEMRPRDDPSIRANGTCYMCQHDDQRSRFPVAQKNVSYFFRREEELRRENDELRRVNEELERGIERLKGTLTHTR